MAAIRQGVGPVDGKGRPLLRENLPGLDFWVGKPIGLGRPSKKSFWDEKITKYKPVRSYILGGSELSAHEMHGLVPHSGFGTNLREFVWHVGYLWFRYPYRVHTLPRLSFTTIQRESARVKITTPLCVSSGLSGLRDFHSSPASAAAFAQRFRAFRTCFGQCGY